MDEESKNSFKEQTQLLAQIAHDIRSMEASRGNEQDYQFGNFCIVFVAPIIVSAIFLPKLIQSFHQRWAGCTARAGKTLILSSF